MFPSAFKWRKDRLPSPSDDGSDLTSAFTPVDCKEIDLIGFESSPKPLPTAIPGPSQLTTTDVSHQAFDETDASNLVEDSKDSIDPSEMSFVEVESTAVDPTEFENEYGGVSSKSNRDFFDTTLRGVRKSDLWALAAEMEAVKIEKAELQKTTNTMINQVAQAEAREKEAKDEVDRSLKRIGSLEDMLSEERKRFIKAEEGLKAQINALDHQLQEEQEKSKNLERELKDAWLLHELVKKELKRNLEATNQQLASSEKRVRRAELESYQRYEQVVALEQALRAERIQARDDEEILRRELTEVKKAKTEASYKYDKAMKSILRLEEKAKKLETQREESKSRETRDGILMIAMSAIITLLALTR